MFDAISIAIGTGFLVLLFAAYLIFLDYEVGTGK